MAYTSKGNKPINAKTLDGGASWKDRYQVDDNTADIIKVCLTMTQAGNEACLIITNMSSITFSNYFTSAKEKFPVGSIAVANDGGTLKIFVKGVSGWSSV